MSALVASTLQPLGVLLTNQWFGIACTAQSHHDICVIRVAKKLECLILLLSKDLCGFPPTEFQET